MLRISGALLRRDPKTFGGISHEPRIIHVCVSIPPGEFRSDEFGKCIILVIEPGDAWIHGYFRILSNV